MEHLTKTERNGLWAAIALAALALASVHTVRSCRISGILAECDSTALEMEQFVKQSEDFRNDTIPSPLKRKRKHTGEAPRNINPLNNKLGRK